MNEIKSFRNQYSFLSNFFPCDIELEGLVYPSSEHAYQAYKTAIIEDRIIFTDKQLPAKEAKRLGKYLSLREDWERIKLEVMEDILRNKFKQHPTLSRKLLETGNLKISEGNYWGDDYWGVSLKTGIGENHLGKILMKIRNELKKYNLNGSRFENGPYN